MPYPDAKQELNRWLPIVKWFLAIPHYIILFFLYIAAFFCVIAAWFAILFTGRYPKGLFDFIVGVGRWSNRVTAYAFVLTTDKYPPFSLPSLRTERRRSPACTCRRSAVDRERAVLVDLAQPRVEAPCRARRPCSAP